MRMLFIEHPHYETKAGQVKNEIRTRFNAYKDKYKNYLLVLLITNMIKKCKLKTNFLSTVTNLEYYSQIIIICLDLKLVLFSDRLDFGLMFPGPKVCKRVSDRIYL